MRCGRGFSKCIRRKQLFPSDVAHGTTPQGHSSRFKISESVALQHLRVVASADDGRDWRSAEGDQDLFTAASDRVVSMMESTLGTYSCSSDAAQGSGVSGAAIR